MTGERVMDAVALAVSAFTVVACGDERDQWRTEVVENSGFGVCLTSENGSLSARVSVNACVSSSRCRRARTTVCQANISAGRITITSRAEVLVTTDERICPDVCSPVVTTCSVALPADGSYAVVHGSDQAEVTIPFSGGVELFSEDACPEAE